MIIYQKDLFKLIPSSISKFPNFWKIWKWKNFLKSCCFVSLHSDQGGTSSPSWVGAWGRPLHPMVFFNSPPPSKPIPSHHGASSLLRNGVPRSPSLPPSKNEVPSRKWFLQKISKKSETAIWQKFHKCKIFSLGAFKIS